VKTAVITYQETNVVLTTAGTKYNVGNADLITCTNWDMFESINTKVYKDATNTTECVHLKYN
jgi:hypothetical protein